MAENPDRAVTQALFDRYVTVDNLRKHSLATEAVMRELAPRFGADPDTWGTAGLLHDLDYDATRDDMPRHSLVTAEILRGHGYPEEILRAITAHNALHTGVEPESPFELLLAAGESLTGMISAMALILPSKRVADVKASSIIKRMKEPAFARTVNRDDIRLAERAGLTLDEFISAGIRAMQRIAPDLGL
jgi:putative nucleotidyltransferase with HDIG domain